MKSVNATCVKTDIMVLFFKNQLRYCCFFAYNQWAYRSQWNLKGVTNKQPKPLQYQNNAPGNCDAPLGTSCLKIRQK